MSDTLNTSLVEQAAYPYAVEIPDEDGPVFLHFADKPAAALFADVMGEGIKRYVAVTDVYLKGDSGWREVTWFLL